MDILSIVLYLVIPLVSAIVGAVVGAVVGQLFNLYTISRITKSNQLWKENRHLITCCEKFCDDLLEYTVQYWRIDLTEHISMHRAATKANEAKVLSGKIITSIMLITNFIQQSFIYDTDIQDIQKKMFEEITGNDFAVQNRPANYDRVLRSIGSIVKLRGALTNAKQKH